MVIAGVLHDPYTGRVISFEKAHANKVQIDHVVALGDAWQSGAATWSATERREFANDPLNLLAVSGSQNESKGDGDASEYLPPNAAFDCAYVQRQVAVKQKYKLTVTASERDAISAGTRSLLMSPG